MDAWYLENGHVSMLLIFRNQNCDRTSAFFSSASWTTLTVERVEIEMDSILDGETLLGNGLINGMVGVEVKVVFVNLFGWISHADETLDKALEKQPEGLVGPRLAAATRLGQPLV